MRIVSKQQKGGGKQKKTKGKRKDKDSKTRFDKEEKEKEEDKESGETTSKKRRAHRIRCMVNEEVSDNSTASQSFPSNSARS